MNYDVKWLFWLLHQKKPTTDFSQCLVFHQILNQLSNRSFQSNFAIFRLNSWGLVVHNSLGEIVTGRCDANTWKSSSLWCGDAGESWSSNAWIFPTGLGEFPQKNGRLGSGNLSPNPGPGERGLCWCQLFTPPPPESLTVCPLKVTPIGNLEFGRGLFGRSTFLTQWWES